MCGLCGVLGAEDHWTDAAARPETFGGARTTRRQERFARIADWSAAMAERLDRVRPRAAAT